MRRLLKTGALLCLLSGFSTAYAVDFAHTSLTRVCKPLFDKNYKIPKPPLGSLDERTYKRMSKAQEKLAEDLYPEGIEMLKKILESARNDYVRATINIQIAYALAQSGKQDDSYPYFRNALKYGENSLPNDRVQSLRETIAGFLYGNGEKQKAIDMLKEWLSKSNVGKVNVFYILAAIYLDDDISQPKNAICPAYYAIKMSPKADKKHFQILFAAHYQLKDIVGATNIQKTMVEFFPENKDYWRQLASLYLQLNKYKDALAVMEMLYLKGDFDKENDYKQLASLFGYEEVYLRSAQIMEEGILKGIVKPEEKNWKSVAQNYQLSSEISKAINAYGKTAEISEDGKAYLRQADLFGEKEEWSSAIKAFDLALKKGGLEDKGRAYLNKGRALISMGRCGTALQVLDQASKFKRHRRQAVSLTNYTKDRQRRKKC